MDTDALDIFARASEELHPDRQAAEKAAISLLNNLLELDGRFGYRVERVDDRIRVTLPRFGWANVVVVQGEVYVHGGIGSEPLPLRYDPISGQLEGLAPDDVRSAPGSPTKAKSAMAVLADAIVAQIRKGAERNPGF